MNNNIKQNFILADFIASEVCLLQKTMLTLLKQQRYYCITKIRISPNFFAKNVNPLLNIN